MKLWITLLLSLAFLQAKTFTLANYNVQNLFDLQKSGHEYIDYIPFTKSLWNKKSYKLKLQNISQVIHEMHPDIIALQEIESDSALKALQSVLKDKGSDYAYRCISHKKNTTVKVAVLSKFPIINSQEIIVNPYDRIRPILDVRLDIEGKDLRLFVNHWKSKRGPESKRIPYAKALAQTIKDLDTYQEYLIVGDLNSNYNEFQTFKKSQKFNNTKGVTGINHFLKTSLKQRMVSFLDLQKSRQQTHYNLWMELAVKQRWSYLYKGRGNSLDHIIIPRSLADHKGIDYLPASFRRFTPSYLLKKRKIFRWKFSYKGGYKHHLAQGYSDHLPIMATFSY